MDEYLVLPGCDDTNRGDQALIWETVNIAREAGFNGTYYMLADDEHSKQSKLKGINNIKPILEHPSIHFKKTNNIYYTKLLKLQWGIVSLIDIIYTLPLLNHKLRKILLPLYNQNVKNSLVHYNKSSASFVKGGGFLHAYGGIAESYKIYYFLYHINLALSCGHDVYVMPNSFGPFKAPFVKKMIYNTLSKCKIVSTRESISNKILEQECNIKSINIPDLAFYLNKTRYEQVKNKLIKSGIPIGIKQCVAITVRPYRFPGEKYPIKLYNKYIMGITEFIKWLCENNFFPVLVEHVSSELIHEDDLIAIKDITKRLDNYNGDWCIFSDLELNCEEMKSVYSCFDYTIGTRFHSVIFSLAEKVPAIAITYGGNKGKGIMYDIGMNEYSIDIKDVNKDLLISKFNRIIKNRNYIVEKLINLQKDMQKQRKDFLQKL